MNPDKIALLASKTTYRLINIVSEGLFKSFKHFNGVNKILTKNKELQTIDNESCIICGNGPSINSFDFSKSRKIPVFTMNFFYKGDTEVQNKNRYHLLIDGGFKNTKYHDYINEIYKNNQEVKFIFRYDMKDIIEEIDPTLARAYFIHSKYVQIDNMIKFDMTKNMTSCHNTVLMAIQSAMYMGYKNIYLIGVEHNFFANYKHFYDSEDYIHQSKKWEGMLYYDDKVFKHHHALDVTSRNHGIKIFNITPESMLDTYERIDLDNFYNAL
ncbi:hypothetical protein APT62_03050 [Aerococcus urinaeequi]|uniref:hypothetical protein n=1 Tax=Aerococcus urinaeequi TaxID=51665 RepID=UPI000744B71B|nr:hypothetical protein [Aerococcus urinaeequi]ALZ87494.1 hypothetical protein APT62_03050 [Aerococcus urinaeequi]